MCSEERIFALGELSTGLLVSAGGAGEKGGGRSDGIPATSMGEGRPAAAVPREVQGRPRDGEGEAAMKQGLKHDTMRGRRWLEGGREQGGS